MFGFKCLLVFLVACVVELNAGAVPFITPCKKDDKECIRTVAQSAIPIVAAGIPELGVPVSDPISVDSVRSDDKNLKLGFRNLKIYGVSKSKIIDIERTDQSIKLEIQSPLHAVGQYDLNGKLLFIEVIGDGDFDIKTDMVDIKVELKLKESQKDGKKYWKITGYDYTYDILKKVYFDFKNLFGGDKERAKPFLEILDNSWKELIDEVGKPIIDKLIGHYAENLKTFFRAVPIEELVIV